MSAEAIPARMRQDLMVALKSRDQVTVEALRCALSAIDNAGSSGMAAEPARAIEEAPRGAGSTDVDRSALGNSEVRRILLLEAAERESSASLYAAAGRDERARELTAQAETLRAYL